MKTKILYFALSFFIFAKVSGQEIDVDSKGNSVFTYYSFDEFRINIDDSEPLSLSYASPKIKTIYIQKKEKRKNLDKLSGINFKLSMLNSNDNVLSFDKLKGFCPGFGAKLGWQKTINNIEPESFKKKTKSKFFYATTWGINGILKYETFRYYNVIDSSVKRVKPLSIGVEFNYNIYVPLKENFKFFIALTGQFLNTWNSDELINYQKLPNFSLANQKTIVGLNDFEGRYGELHQNINTGRISLSFPIYIRLFNPTVFISRTITNKYIANVTGVGILLNFLNENFKISETTLPSSIGIGLDNYLTNSSWGSPNIYLKASVGFGKTPH